MQKREVLAIIPARGGSKGIPRKNIKPLKGYPLISYSIAAGLLAETVTRVIVSTDDDEIANVARSYGAEVPFLRPAEFAQDETTDLPVFQNALSWLSENEHYHPDFIVQLRPTSPFRPHGLINQAVKLLAETPEATSVRGIIPSGQNPYKMWQLHPDGMMIPLISSDLKEPYNMPRQKLPPTYWQTGHIDVIRSGVIQNGSMSGDIIYPVHIDPAYMVDLDNLLDWERAEWRMRDPQLRIVGPEDLDQTTNKDFRKRPLPQPIELIVFDFDGVMTDNRVQVDQDGIESVVAHRGDGMGIEMLRNAGIEMLVLSTEPNPVVAARSQKLKLPYYHGVGKKDEILAKILAERKLNPQNVIYVGNDINDQPCFPLVGCVVAVADAHPSVRNQADIVLTLPGGYGAVREFCDMVLANMRNS